jgi:hypothetical protein
MAGERHGVCELAFSGFPPADLATTKLFVSWSIIRKWISRIFQYQGDDKCGLNCSVTSVFLNTQSLNLYPGRIVLGDMPISFFFF